MTGIPSDAKYYRSSRGRSTLREFRQMLAEWIADDVADGRTPPEGLIWIYRAARCLDRIHSHLHNQRGQEWASKHGIEPGAHVRLSDTTQGVVEGIVEAVNGWWAILDTKPAPGYLLIGAEVEVILPGCLHDCIRGEGHDGPCMTDEDIAEERLKARDYDTWAAL